MMKVLLRRFENLQSKYLANRDRFKSAIQGFKDKNKTSLYKKSSHLFEEADGLIKELKADFYQTAEGQVHAAVVYKKMRTLRKIYKELNEMTKPVIRQWVEAIVIALGLALILRNFIFGLYHVPTGSAEPNILVGDRIWGNKMAYFVSPVKHGDLVIFDNPLFEYDRSSKIHYLWQRYIGFPILGFGAGPDNWVKRVIACPGDVIQGRVEDGRTTIYVNGKKLDEPYVNPYPLIHLRKNKGFLPFERIGFLSIPKFLVYGPATGEKFTYDPSKSLADQPFYRMNEDEVIMRRDGHGPELENAFSPIYEHRLGRCVDEFGPYTVPAKKYWVMGDSRLNSIDSRWWLFLDESLIHGRASFVIFSIDSEEAFWLFELIKHPIDFWAKHIRWNRFFRGLNGFNTHKS